MNLKIRPFFLSYEEFSNLHKFPCSFIKFCQLCDQHVTKDGDMNFLLMPPNFLFSHLLSHFLLFLSFFFPFPKVRERFQLEAIVFLTGHQVACYVLSLAPLIPLIRYIALRFAMLRFLSSLETCPKKLTRFGN